QQQGHEAKHFGKVGDVDGRGMVTKYDGSFCIYRMDIPTFGRFNTTTKQPMNNLKISIRRSKLSDLTEMQKMFVDTITAVCKEDYTPEQIKVSTSSIEYTQRWTDKLTSQYFIISE